MQLSKISNRPLQSILPGASAGQTTKNRKDNIWPKQKRSKRSSQKKGKKRAREEQTPVGHRRKAKSVAVTDEGGTWFAHIVGFFVISSKKREPINGTHAETAAAIISSNGPLQHAVGDRIGDHNEIGSRRRNTAVLTPRRCAARGG